MADLLPACHDSEWELQRKILLQFLSMATNPPQNIYPVCSDSKRDLYRKILLALPFI